MHLSFSPEKGSDAARRLIACIIGANEPTGNRAHEAVSAVEMHLLQRGWPVGTALGALPDVQKRLSLGRPACREEMCIRDRSTPCRTVASARRAEYPARPRVVAER